MAGSLHGSGSTERMTGELVTLNGNGAEAEDPDLANLRKDVAADERDPSRFAPSAEGIVSFAGLSPEVRQWLAGRLADMGSNGSGSNGHGSSA